jgi:hypothetical protein
MLTAEVSCVSPSPRTIIELNIKHFRDLLMTETDPAKRETLAKLLAEHEAKLSTFVRSGKAGEH